MYQGTIEHDDIIRAFRRHVPGCYVADYRDKGGYITLFRGLRDIPWKDQTTTRKVYRQVPAETLASLPRGNVTSSSIYYGLRLHRPGWRQEFRRARRHLTQQQMYDISEELGKGEVFSGIVPRG